MADHDRYDDDYRRRRDRDDEGFFDQLRGWFRGDDSQRRRESREGYNRDRNRWGSGSGDWYNRDMERNQDRERTRQWRQGYGQQNDRTGSRVYGRNTFGDQYGENYERSAWDRDSRDFNRYGSGRGADRDFDYSEGYGRSYNRGSYYGRDRDMNRDWEQEYRDYGRDRSRSTSSPIYDTDWYDWNFERGYEEDEYNRDPNQFYGYGQNYEWDNDQNRWQRSNRGFDRDASRDRNRGRGRQYGTAGMGSDYEGRSGQYRSAGMRSDYGRSGYDSQDYGEGDLDYRRGDIGYESEGAFYQDLDEPVNFTYYEVWMIPGEYTGMGPQNYKRSDERIKEEVCERLTHHGRIDASNVEIDVKDGEVTLKGTVHDREMKRLAEDTVDAVGGVNQVHNEIKVQRREQEQGASWGRGQSEEYNRREKQQQRNRQGSQQIPTTGAGMASPTMQSTTGEDYESSSAMHSATGKRSQLREDMEVIGSSGKVIGRVKEIREGDFLVDRDMARDVYVPFDRIRSVGAQVMLDIQEDEVDNQDWEKPDIL